VTDGIKSRLSQSASLTVEDSEHNNRARIKIAPALSSGYTAAAKHKMLDFAYSGHETFSLRISWLPKAVAALERQIDPFSDPREGMTTLGLGKNMVQSLAFWVLATGVATKGDDGLELTNFAKQILGRVAGFDPYLENNQTLWLLHWNLCQGWQEGERHRRPYAWHYFANVLTDDVVTATETVDHFAGAPVTSGRDLSSVTLRQHFEIFIRTYVEGETSGPRAIPEETLDSPLATLRLLKENGDKKLHSGRRETAYRFVTGPKPSLSARTFRYCLHQWWNKNHNTEGSLTIRQIAHDEDSSGRCFRLPETAIHKMLVDLTKDFPREFQIEESRSQRTVKRMNTPAESALIKAIYKA
jgi:hypothetical protein